jgi:DNA-binding transcriptional ArsR family regulator
MLRIHFTDADLARVQVATRPDPLWETVLGLHQLIGPQWQLTPDCDGWRRRARAELSGRGLGGPVRLLASLAPPVGPYFPDFLTPAEAGEGLAAGLEAVRATPPARLRHELALLAAANPHPRRTAYSSHRIPHGGPPLPQVADALRAVHRTVIDPDWTQVAGHVEADRAVRLRALRDGGTTGLLESLRPMAVWRAPVLHVAYPLDRDMRLDGRGLRLVPSRFCRRMPMALGDPGLPPVLVYPAASGGPDVEDGIAPATHPAALRALLGTTRARVLSALAATATTGELAVRLGISAASASKHARALREASLVASRRDGGTVVHTLTPLGSALLRGELPGGTV